MKEFFKRNPKQPGANDEKPEVTESGEGSSVSKAADTNSSNEAGYSPKFAWIPLPVKPETGKSNPQAEDKHEIPGNLWIKCAKCKELIYTKEFETNKKVCTKCGYHVRLNARERIKLLVDEGSFEELDANIITADPLNFTCAVEPPYHQKMEQTRKKLKINESLVTGLAKIDGKPLALVVCDFSFQGGSMGGVFGEKMVRLVETAIKKNLPVLSVSASGGARMHEGIFSLMQLAKFISCFAKLGEHKLPHFSLFTDPTLGGVTASYASVADVTLAEPGATIGFAGARVIEQTTRQKLPPGFQTAEFLMDHGMIDIIVHRKDLKSKIATLLQIYSLAQSQREALNNIQDEQNPPSNLEVAYA